MSSSNKKIQVTNMYNVNTEETGCKLKAVGLGCSEYGKTHPLKAGEKATIRFSVKQNGKTYRLSCKVTFKSSASPVKTVKLGKKSYAGSLFKGRARILTPTSGSKAKLVVKAASGYKIGEIVANYGDDYVKIKNRSTISTKNLDAIIIYYRVTKKPANYQKPSYWNAGSSWKSPLYDKIVLVVDESIL